MRDLPVELQYHAITFLDASSLFRFEVAGVAQRRLIELARTRRLLGGRVRAFMRSELSYGAALLAMLDAAPDLADQLPVAGSHVLQAIQGERWTAVDGADCDFWAQTGRAAVTLKRWLVAHRRHVNGDGSDDRNVPRPRGQRSSPTGGGGGGAGGGGPAKRATNAPLDDESSAEAPSEADEYPGRATIFYNFESTLGFASASSASAADPVLQILRYEADCAERSQPTVEPWETTAETTTVTFAEAAASERSSPTGEAALREAAVDSDDGEDEYFNNDDPREIDAARRREERADKRAVRDTRGNDGSQRTAAYVEAILGGYDWDWCKCAWTPRRGFVLLGKAALRDRAATYRRTFREPASNEYARMLRRTMRYARRGYHGRFLPAELAAFVTPMRASGSKTNRSSPVMVRLLAETRRFRQHLGDLVEHAPVSLGQRNRPTGADGCWRSPAYRFRESLFDGAFWLDVARSSWTGRSVAPLLPPPPPPPPTPVPDSVVADAFDSLESLSPPSPVVATDDSDIAAAVKNRGHAAPSPKPMRPEQRTALRIRANLVARRVSACVRQVIRHLRDPAQHHIADPVVRAVAAEVPDLREFTRAYALADIAHVTLAARYRTNLHAYAPVYIALFLRLRAHAIARHHAGDPDPWDAIADDQVAMPPHDRSDTALVDVLGSSPPSGEKKRPTATSRCKRSATGTRRRPAGKVSDDGGGGGGAAPNIMVEIGRSDGLVDNDGDGDGAKEVGDEVDDQRSGPTGGNGGSEAVGDETLEQMYARWPIGSAAARVCHYNFDELWALHAALVCGVAGHARFRVGFLGVQPTREPLADIAHVAYCRRSGWCSELPHIVALDTRLATTNAAARVEESPFVEPTRAGDTEDRVEKIETCDGDDRRADNDNGRDSAAVPIAKRARVARRR
jgi:hypothetical protein